MAKSLKELHALMVDQLVRRNFYPVDEQEVILRIGEEVGELYEAIRKKSKKKAIAEELVDVLWNLMRFCELKKIDLEDAFLEKLAFNETRPLEKKRV